MKHTTRTTETDFAPGESCVTGPIFARGTIARPGRVFYGSTPDRAPRSDPVPPGSKRMRRNHLSNAPRARRGVASIELAFVFMFFMIPMMIGIWEVGRLVQVQQIVSNAAREGARLSAQGFTINSSGVPTQIKVASGSASVRETVYDHLHAAGLTGLALSDVTVNFAYTSGRTTAYVPVSADPPGTSYGPGSMPPDPCYGEKGMTFNVTVTIPWEKVRWINIGLVNPNAVTFTVNWQMLTDERFTVNDQLPMW
jgi:Flp pilus assembly protein TadG